MEILKETEYLKFIVVPQRSKTKIIDIINIRHDEVIGEIKWFGRWRQYCFYPNDNTIWNKTCLDDVQEVIYILMNERKNK